jgi:7,8-dihydropterin-6-yl-methyl-4-(beta-D-ribofuranosyl)aminobenzene 5'-phosphate synthase
MVRQGEHGRKGCLWLVVILLCMIAVCLGQHLEGFLLASGEVEGGGKRGPVMEGPSTLPTPAADPGVTPTSAATPPLRETDAADSNTRVIFTVVYDNNPHDPRLKTMWGFACVVETPHGVVLFDTGGDGGILLANLEALGLDPRRIQAVVLSHIHSDHVGGLEVLLRVNSELVVYLPQSFPESFIAGLAGRTRVVAVAGWQEVLEGIYTTGEMGDKVMEQSLVVETPRGLVVITGCAHPGVAMIVRRVREEGPVFLVMGGFHLEATSPAGVREVIDEFRALGVSKVAPSHCTGKEATAAFAEAFGPDFIAAGAGTVVSIGP